MSDTLTIPYLRAYAHPNGMWTVWCAHCRRWHWHGPKAGHRFAHCLRAGSPYADTGYHIVGADPAPGWVVADVHRRPSLGPLEGA